MELQALASSVFRRRDDRHFTLLRKQAALCRTSAQALWKLTSRDADATSTLDVVDHLEEEGWRMASDMETLLTRTLSTPIDREDLHTLSSRFGLVLDRTSHAAHACTLLDDVARAPKKLAESHVHAMEKLVQAVDALATRVYDQAIVNARDVRRISAEEIALEEHAGGSRGAAIGAQVRGQFAALFRASRASGELVICVARKHE